MRAIALVVVLFLSHVYGHSWVACTDYREENGLVYDPSKCFGFPRGWKDFNPNAAFGTDLGFDFQSSGACSMPPSNPPSAGYDANTPMAKYVAGSKVCLAWPPKNHVAAVCNNPWIPDGGTQIFYSTGNDANFQLLEDWGATQVPANDSPSQTATRKGYQNCPNFCSNNDKALCTGCFTAPATPGTYNFQWRWKFNSATYITCWDAEVTAATPGTPPPNVNPPPSTNPTPTPTPNANPNPNPPSTNPTPVQSNPNPNPNTPNPNTPNPPNNVNNDPANLNSGDNGANGGSYAQSMTALLVLVVVVLVVIIVLLIVALVMIKKTFIETA